MAKEELLTFEGEITDLLPNANFRVKLENDHEIIATLAGKLRRAYASRYNKGEGDKDFNEAGVFLHNIYFPQFRSPRNANVPRGAIKTFIDKHFGSFVDFKKDMKTEAMKLQGSSWVYLNRAGGISTIRNHQIRRNVVLLIDWWEHAWIGTYGADKGRYIDNIWRIINWEHINRRLGGGIQDG